MEEESKQVQHVAQEVLTAEARAIETISNATQEEAQVKQIYEQNQRAQREQECHVRQVLEAEAHQLQQEKLQAKAEYERAKYGEAYQEKMSSRWP